MTKSDKRLQNSEPRDNVLSMGGKAFQSKLIPHFDLIGKLRRTKTWQEIVDHLAALGVKTDTGNVYRFYKRHRIKPYPLGREPEGEIISDSAEENPNGGFPVTPAVSGANARSKSPSAEQSTNKKTTAAANVPTAGSRTFKFGDPYAELAELRRNQNG